MIDSEIRNQTYQFFLEEAPELLQTLETSLLSLKQERTSAVIHDLMRAAHSLKGGAATVGLDAIETIAHRLESIFRALYSDTVEIDTELESWLLEAYDCLKEPLQQQITQGQVDRESALTQADTVFNKIEARLGDALKDGERYIPSSSDLGVDMVSSLFEVDVAQGIERLVLVADNPQEYDVETELRTQTEIFAGFAEILELPGFEAIAQTTITALDANGDRALELLPVALADFQAAKEAVLAGDRTQGGSPSEALVAFTENTESELSEDTPVISEPPQFTETEAVPYFEDITDLENLLFEELPETETTEALEVPLEALASEPEPEALEVPLEALASEPEPEFLETTTIEAEAEAETIETVETVLISPESSESESQPSFSQEVLESDSQPLFSQEVLESDSQPLFSQETFAKSTSGGKTTSQPKPSDEAPKVTSPSKLKVRVDLHRLEKMNNFVGELVISRNSLALQQEQLRRIVQKIQQGLEKFQQLTSQFQGISDQSLVAPINSQINPQESSSISPEEIDGLELSNFDSLEMDRYGTMHSSIEGVLEEIMQLEEGVEDLNLLTRQSDNTIKQQQQTLTKLREELMWARMLPLETILNRFPRALRDLSIEYDKPVSLDMSGTEILVDKGILEKLHDPILHLVRNAFDHGIEVPEIRSRQGKSETGKIRIRAAHQGNRTLIEVGDDGGGLDLEKIAQRAIERGWLSFEELADTSKEQLLDYIFEPGFSTAERVSELSGRGVGLDVVRSQLQAVKGTVKVTSSPRKGTTFTLSLPLTLTIAKLLVCSVEATLVALPAASIQEILVPKTNITKQIGDQRVVPWREQLLPVYRIADLLEYRYPITVNPENKNFLNVSASESGIPPILIIRGEEQNFALEIEGFGTEQEMVIKPLPEAIPNPNYMYGCTVLGDGSLIPAIDATALLDYVREQKQTRTSTQNNRALPATFTNQNSLTTIHVPTILIVDDSAMMRRTLTLTLQKVGYRVLQARDGWEAIELLQKNTQVRLIVSDLEMPKLNGFEFLNQLRQNSELAQIPTVMLTSRSNNKHRQLAMHLGASAYLSKPYIEQEFLSVLETIIDREPDKSNMPSLPSAI